MQLRARGQGIHARWFGVNNNGIQWNLKGVQQRNLHSFFSVMTQLLVVYISYLYAISTPKWQPIRKGKKVNNRTVLISHQAMSTENRKGPRKSAGGQKKKGITFTS